MPLAHHVTCAIRRFAVHRARGKLPKALKARDFALAVVVDHSERLTVIKSCLHSGIPEVCAVAL